MSDTAALIGAIVMAQTNGLIDKDEAKKQIARILKAAVPA